MISILVPVNSMTTMRWVVVQSQQRNLGLSLKCWMMEGVLVRLRSAVGGCSKLVYIQFRH